MRTRRAHVPVLVRSNTRKALELWRYLRPKNVRMRFVWRSAGWSLKTLTRLVLRATPLKKRITAVDTMPKATRTPPPVPIRAHPSECLLLLRARKKTASCTCV